MRVDTLLRDVLTATAQKAAAERRIARLRDVLDREARARYAAEGAAPTWKAPKLGTVRLDPKEAAPYVADGAAFASYVAERFPDEVTATITVPAAQLEAALEALTFAGVDDRTATVDVRPAFATTLLADVKLAEDVDESDPPVVLSRSALRIVDEETGEAEPVPGVSYHDPGATLVVTLDRDLKARTIADVDAQLEAEEADRRVEAEEAEETAGPFPVAVDDTVAPGTVQLVDSDLRVVATITGLDRPHRRPYVDDPDPVAAALRSADMDLEELDTLPTASQPGYAEAAERRAHLTASAERWKRQAAELRAAELAGDEAPLIDPAYPAAGRVRPPAPELSAEERAIVDRFEAAPDALLELEPTEDTTITAVVDTTDGPQPITATDAATMAEACTSDQLKRAARAKRLSVAGTKLDLATRLLAAGVTLDVDRELVDVGA